MSYDTRYLEVGMTEHPRGGETRRRQRRVADEHRKRSAQSCDLCRKKRCKCVPSTSNREICVACQAQDLACTYSLPRKTRFYGNLDDLSDRYRCLDALVKAVFPNETTDSAQDLWHLGQRMGFAMPDISCQSASPVNPEEILKPRSASVAGITASSSAESDAPPAPPSELNGASSSSINHKEHPELTRSSSVEDNVRLVRDTTGGEHYIGPSGSLQFLAQLRRLLISHNSNLGAYSNDRATTKFTEDDTAQALEADSSTQVATAPDDSHVEQQRQQRHHHPHQPDRITVDHAIADGHSPGSVNSSIAQDFIKPSAEDVQGQRRELPPPEIMELLLQSYWKHVHQDYPLFHRGTFEEEYEAFISQSKQWRPQASSTDSIPCDWGWIGCLRMMLVFGSVSEPRIPMVNHTTLRRQCVVATRRLLPQLVSRCTLSNVRALVLLSLFLHNNNERNASWVLMGAAVRCSIALGLHRGSALSSFRPIEREVRKRVFCTLYGFEQFLASSLGRPSGLNDVDIELNPPKAGLLDGSNAHGDQLLELSSSLHRILAKARVVSDRQGSGSSPKNRSFLSAEDVLQSLDAWNQSVSANRSRYIPAIKLGMRIFEAFDQDAMDLSQLSGPLGWQDPSHLRETLLLHAEYRYIGLLVTRASLLKDVAASSSSFQDGKESMESDNTSSIVCLWHACQLTQIILLLDSFGRLNGVSSLDVFYAYSAAMVLILRLLRRPPLGKTLTSNDTTANAAAEREDAEEELRKGLHTMIVRLKEVVSKVEKSGTMRRFARVMTTFEECILQRTPNDDEAATSAARGHQEQDGTNLQQGGNVSGASNAGHYFASPIPTVGAAAATVPSFRYHQQAASSTGMPLVGMAGLTTFSGWSTQGMGGDTFNGLPDSGLWMGPDVIMDNHSSPVEWRDVESLLANVVPSWN
ncbi:fungal-specific transcription factor domain-containing protein [Xylariales sp. PMI_506]|nr:fungal-specific transcription factor domain-containing protein [Xylariales sp. PMI_506]